MEKSYFRTIAEHFAGLKMQDLPEETLHQVRRALVNYMGGSIYTASHNSCSKLLEMLRTLDNGTGSARVWADERPASAMIAACSNAARLSSLELNDGAGASSHPGIYVWSAALATYQQYGGTVGDLVRSVVFGYEVAARMAKLCVEKVLELGLHNPGFVGGMGAVSAAGMMRGLTVDQLCNAFGIVGALTPLCPFRSFIEGADSKDLYGGWGTYLAMFAVEAASKGLTGPDHVLEGMKSLESVFCSKDGKEIEIGKPYMIENLSIKQYPACFAINPAVNAVFKLLSEHEVDPEQIKSVLVDTYPYSYDLNEGVGRDPNTTSGRLSLYYTVAVALMDHDIKPDAFTPEKLYDEKYQALKDKIRTRRRIEYGDSATSIRGCIVTVEMNDGTVYSAEYNATETKKIYTDEMLFDKFTGLTEEALDNDTIARLFGFAMELEKQNDMDPVLSVLNGLKKVRV